MAAIEIHPIVQRAVLALAREFPTGHEILATRTPVWFTPGHGVVVDSKNPEVAQAFLREHHPDVALVAREPGSTLSEIGLKESWTGPAIGKPK